MLEYEVHDHPWPGGGRIDSYLSWDDRQIVIRTMSEAADRAMRPGSAQKNGQIREVLRWAVVCRHSFPTYG